jgi:hypothetical protein
MGVSELRRLRLLEEENRKLKQLVADLSLDKHILQEVVKKKVLRPAQKRVLVVQINAWYEVGLQRACGLMVLERSSFYYRSHPRDHRGLSMRIKELAMTRIWPWKFGSGCISYDRCATSNRQRKHPANRQKLNLLPDQKSGEDQCWRPNFGSAFDIKMEYGTLIVLVLIH